MSNDAFEGKVSRRAILKLTGVALAAAPTLWIKNAAAAEPQVVIRSPGGAYDDIRKKLIYEPFLKQTGIRVVTVPVPLGKMEAMIRANNFEVDCYDGDDSAILQWENELAPIEYAKFKFTDPADILPEYKHSNYVGNFVNASVLGFNTGKFNSKTAPSGWAEFWDYKKFPGARSLAGIDTGIPDLEFALIADGVEMHKLYPLDLPRAFRSLSRIKPAISNFYTSGAMSVQMLSTGESVLSSMWSTRINKGIEDGAPMAINWNEHAVRLQAYAVFKKAKNYENAQKLVDFSLSKAVQSKFSYLWNSSPVTKAAYEALTPDMREKVPGGDRTRKHGFVIDAKWWAANRPEVVKEWTKWATTT